MTDQADVKVAPLDGAPRFPPPSTLEAAAVRRERDALRRQAEAAWREVTAARLRADEVELLNRRLSRASEDLRAALAAAIAERDAARAEAERARRRVDALTRGVTAGPCAAVDAEPPTGLHPLEGIRFAPVQERARSTSV